MNGYVPVEKALGRAWKVIHQLDWNDTKFEIEKAYICAVFSEAVYSHLTAFELKQGQRVAVIPCFKYAELLATRQTVDIITLFRAAGIGELSEVREVGDFFTIVTKYLVVVGVKTPNVIIVSMRGTQSLWDFLVDIHIATYQFRFASEAVRFHRGFFLAVARCMEDLMSNLHNYASVVSLRFVHKVV